MAFHSWLGTCLWFTFYSLLFLYSTNRFLKKCDESARTRDELGFSSLLLTSFHTATPVCVGDTPHTFPVTTATL